MLEHATGMIGLPLRLLAREVYDKVTSRVGEDAVALVTGEERRIPRRPAYWIATVEAMPVDREVEFLAVDEVQLAAHAQRGHVFTSRLLAARGTRETWFMGAGTMRAALRELVPTAQQVEHPRLSRLGYAGSVPLARVPERSAVVCFSMPHVYEIAERLRAKKGGAAVVLGGLSPRTRNAQVAMFQAGEVDWLVATDAIGMGLNLDVQHVAFAALRKFDGRDVRDVDDAELAQIAGRAGRWVQDGTFGAVTPLELPTATAAAIETHAFAPVKRVRWRNDALDFGSIADLRASLNVPPPRRITTTVREAEDAMALDRLGLRDPIAEAARGEEAVRLLWDVCTVPDFRKLLFEVHVDFLETLFLALARRGPLDDDWIARHVADLERVDGDVETLVARLSAVRTWTYVSHRSSWLKSPREWQEKTRAIEDALSDALHEKLVARFVESKGRARPRRSRPRDASPEIRDEAPIARAGHPFAKLAAMRAAIPAPRAAPSSPGSPGWIEEIIDARHDAFALEASRRIVHRPSGRIAGEIVRGASIALPDVRLLEAADLGAGAARRVHRRLLAFARDVVADLLRGVRDAAAAGGETATSSAAIRGLVHRLEHGLGTVVAADVDDMRRALDDGTRAALAAAGLRVGGAVVYLPDALRPRAIDARVALATAFYGVALRPPKGGAVSFAPSRGIDPAAYAAIGYPVFGGRAVRADVIDRVERKLAEGEGEDEGEGEGDETLASVLGCPVRDARRILGVLRAANATESVTP
ncbi:MAG: helicase [Labilithrix sp.]|nr:helicase [Labilithrix sp.]